MKLALDVSRLLAITDLRALVQHITSASAAMLDAERARIWLHVAATDELATDDVDGSDRRIPSDLGVVGNVFGGGQSIELTDPYTDPSFDPVADRASGIVTRNVLCAPMRDIDRRTIGVIEVTNKRKGSFTTEDRVSIELLAEHSAVAIQRYRLLLAARKGSELRREMEVARRVQAALLPTSPPRADGLEAAGWARAASVTGGDCYDLWSLPDGRLAVFLADASGHGLGATLVVSQVRTMFRALTEVRTELDWLFARVNARLAQDLDEGRFVTAFFGCVSADGWLHWSSAGQGPIFVRRALGAAFDAFQAPAVPLGVSPDLMADAAEPVRMDLGGMLVAMTDGVFEARSPSGEMFGPARVGTILEQAGDATPSVLIQRIRNAVDAWQGRPEPADDQTVVVVQRVQPRVFASG